MITADLIAKLAFVLTIGTVGSVSIAQLYPSKDKSTLWTDSKEPVSNQKAYSQRSYGIPDKGIGRTMQLDADLMSSLLSVAPEEFSNKKSSASILLPMPDGSYRPFEFRSSTIVEAGLAHSYPDIHTYVISATDGSGYRGRATISPHGFHAYFASLTKGKEVYIKRLFNGSKDYYVVYNEIQNQFNKDPIACQWEESNAGDSIESNDKDRHKSNVAGLDTIGSELRTLRFTISIVGELGQSVWGTNKAQAVADIISFLGEINAVYERDIALRLLLVNNNDQLIFMDPATDPFTANGGAATAEQNIQITNSIIGEDNYDIGMVLVTGACCAASNPSVCSSNKAWNFSRYNNLQVTTHEIGHQLNGRHTWAMCGTERGGYVAHETGGGTTIMGISITALSRAPLEHLVLLIPILMLQHR